MNPNRKRGNVEKQSSMNQYSPKMLSDPAPSGWPSKNRACFVQNCNRQRACMNRNACRCIFRQKSPLETSWNLQIACALLEKKEHKKNTGKKQKIPKLILHPSPPKAPNRNLRPIPSTAQPRVLTGAGLREFCACCTKCSGPSTLSLLARKPEKYS